MSDWGTLERLIERGKLPTLVRVLAELDEPARRALAPALRAFERRVRDEFSPGRGPGVVLAACGLLTPSAAVPMLSRTWFGGRHAEALAGLVLQVLTDRKVDRIPDLALRLAARLQVADSPDERFQLVQALVDGTGMAPPLDAGYAVQWLATAVGSGDPDVLRREVERGPEWVEVLMRALDTPGSGSILAWGGAERVAAVAGGPAGVRRVERARLLDVCLSRLQRGGRRGDLDGVRALHDALDPSAAECAAHAADYLALLPGSHSTVAGLALRQLRRAEEIGPLGPAQLRAAGEAVLVRPDKGLVRAQLSWLDEVAGRPGAAGLAVQTATVAFNHTQASDLQQRALTVVLRHRGKLSGPERDQVLEAARALPSDLRARALTSLGATEPTIDVTSCPPVARLSGGFADSGPGGPVIGGPAGPAGPGARTFLRDAPAPILGIGSPAELAEELAALLGARFEEPCDPSAVERVLGALVEFAWSDRPALGEALHPLISRDEWIDVAPRHRARSTGKGTGRAYDELLAVAGASVAPPDPARRDPQWPPARADGFREGMTRVFAARLAEIGTGLTDAPVPCLLATPTTADGALDPTVLCLRLDRFAAAGVRPWPRDLAQALLRLPPGPHPALAQRIGSFPLRRASTPARWLSGPGDQATVTPAVWKGVTISSHGWPRLAWVADDGTATRRAAEFGPAIDDDARRVLARVSADPGTVGTWPAEWQHVFQLDQSPRGFYDAEPLWRTLWPSMLPWHPDVVAAHLLPELSDPQEKGRQYAAPLPLLAGSPAPFGPATLLALCYGLSAATAEARAAALDALVDLLQDARIDPARLGTTLGELAGFDAVLLSRVVPGLRDLGPAVGWPPVWQVTAAALAVTLPLADGLTVQRLGDLVALAVEAADRIPPGELHPAPGHIPGLTRIAARPGKSRLVTEARRLQHLHPDPERPPVS